jgi:hypothetical protein
MSARRFAFLHDPRFARPLNLLGVTPATCWVDVDDDWLEARYGRWCVRTPRTNVVDVSVSGPYRWFKAVGPRMSLADRGLTFGTAAHGGVCVLFHEPVACLLGDVVRHPGLTVTVADPSGLAAVLSEPG